MRALVQRVMRASVTVDGEVVGAIQNGLLVLLGVRTSDTTSEADWVAERVAHLRIFEDEDGKMNRSLLDVGGEILVVSQFTLYGDCRKGRRPSYVHAARPEQADELYQYFCQRLTGFGVTVARGQFQAMMDVELVNSGPVTVMVEKEATEKV